MKPILIAALASLSLAHVAHAQEPSATAQEVWQQLEVAAVSPEASGSPIIAFDLYFDGRARPRGAQSNDFDKARFRFLDPGWVRTTLQSKRERLRGPAGDFLIDDGRIVPLVGRDYAEDRRELAERAAIAKNFTALSDPARIRAQDLTLLPGPPASLPVALQELGRELQWLTLRTPDLRVVKLAANTAGEPLFRVELGLDPVTHLPALATIAEELDGDPQISTALLIELRKFRDLDGFRIPHEVRNFRPTAVADSWRFAEKPSLELWLLSGGSLRPGLTAQDFEPPTGN